MEEKTKRKGSGGCVFCDISSEIVKPGMKWYEKVLSAITFVFDCLYRVLLEYSKAVLLVIVIITSAQVFARKVLNSSIYWAEEVTLFLMVWTAFIAMAIGVERGLHIAITIFFDHFPKVVQKVLAKVNLIATMFFGYILLVYGVKLTQITMTSTLPATQWPVGLKYSMMPVAGIFILYFSVLEFFGLSKYRHPVVEGHKESDASSESDQQMIERMREEKNAVKEGKK
jgi:TRAP-type C4-dicarboxylate transport system permease small subunit